MLKNITNNFRYFQRYSSAIKISSSGRIITRCLAEDKSCDKRMVVGNSSKNLFQLHPDLHDALNRQLNSELTAYYSYMALEAYFQRVTVNLPGFAYLQRHQMSEELEHSEIIKKLLIARGATVKFNHLQPPQPQEWASPLAAMQAALEIEKTTASGLLSLLDTAKSLGDSHAVATIECKMLEEQIGCIHELNKLIQKMELCPSPECLMLIDESLKPS